MSQKKANQATSGGYGGLIAAGGVIGLVVLVWLAWVCGMVMAGNDSAITWNPFAAVLLLAFGKLPWPGVSYVVLAVLVAPVLGGLLVVERRRMKTSSTYKATERKAAIMPTPRETSGVVAHDIKKGTRDLFPDADMHDESHWGVRVGEIARTRTAVYMSWESVALIVAGPRNGKTQAYAVPAVVACPGPVLVTSNKRDIHDLTRGVREQVGSVWSTDLQHISGEHGGQRDWWFNLLRGVTEITDAQRVASYFADATREDGGRVDSYFDGGAQELLALHLLAAAVSGGDLLHVFGWLAEPNRHLPETLLRDNGQPLAATRIATTRDLNDRQRDGLYDMARRFVSVMAAPKYAAAVVPKNRKHYPASEDSAIGKVSPHTSTIEDRREFIPDEFVASESDTLYALSMEGPDAATSLTTALVGVVFDAAVRLARTNGGRLPRPMLCALDEAANVCKLRGLPGWYSHFGSQGIVPMTFIQSPDQAARVWGSDGVNELVKASNLLIYGGGGKELSTSNQFLAALSATIDDHDVARWSQSTGGNPISGSPKQQSWSRDAKFSSADLAALDKNFAIAIFSNNYPLLLKKRFWSNGPFADAIKDSQRKYKPQSAAAEHEDSGRRHRRGKAKATV